MRKRLHLLRDVLFIIAFAFVGSQILRTLLLAEVFQRTPPAPAPTGLAERDGQGAALPRGAYAAIARRNIFNSASGDLAVDDDPQDATRPEVVERSPANLLLVGTAVGPPEDTYAVIEDLESREQGLYQVGDTLQEAGRVVDVSRCRVVLKRGGNREALACVEPDERPPPRGRRGIESPARGPGAGIRKVSRNRFWIAEERVKSALANLKRLMTKIRVAPNYRGRKGQGWKVLALHPTSLFAQIGLKRGDVIHRVNGRDLLTPENAHTLFRELRDESELNVEIMRKGRLRSLHYEIR